jgi:hypothetical protein
MALQSSLKFAIKQEPTPEEDLKDAPLKGRLLASTLNIRLSQRGLPGTATLLI